MAKYKFKVGDRVRIRQWDDMEKEFGLNSCGSINCKYGFTVSMKKLCGQEATIGEIIDNRVYLTAVDEPGLDSYWSFSTDMIEPVETEKTVEFDRDRAVDRLRNYCWHTSCEECVFNREDGCVTFDNVSDSTLYSLIKKLDESEKTKSEEPETIKEPEPVEESAPKVETVDHPAHYNQSKHECIDEMIALFGVRAVIHFCQCNVYKYRARAQFKGGAEDMKKADWYMDKLIELEGELND